MSVKRIWFPNIPDGKLGIDDRYQLVVGYPLQQEVVVEEVDIERYMRRYLNDPTWEPVGGPAVEADHLMAETTMTRYMRRYLVDPK
jgi:hypothetical protein